MQVSESVIIKGVRDGLLFLLDDDVPFPRILTELVSRINAQPSFFQGAMVTVNAGRRILDRPDFDVLYKMLTRNGMRVQTFVSLSAQSRMVADSYGVSSRPPSYAAGDSGASMGMRNRGTPVPLSQLAAEGALPELGTGLFLRAGLRPGQTLRHEGDVCVLGDVELGADVIADGSVVVWGALRGVVHAGVAGNWRAIVCALEMAPAELTITRVTSRSPSIPGGPHLARLEEDRIVFEPAPFSAATSTSPLEGE